MSSNRASLVVLVSGSGSNLQAIIDAVEKGELNADIKAVISNRDNVKALQRARHAGIASFVIDHHRYNSRETFDQALMACIDQFKPDLIILAGFMRILTADFIAHYANRLINIHPSLLPAYKGLNTHQRVLEAGDKIHGATVHMVNAELDSGAMVIQAEVEVKPDDNAERLAQRVLAQEHIIYPLAISLFIEGRLQVDQHTLLFDNEPLSRPLLWKSNQLITRQT